MYYIELNEKKYPTDASGYLTHLADWSEDLAIEIAKREHIELTDEHWEIIFLVRDFYQEYKTSPEKWQEYMNIYMPQFTSRSGDGLAAGGLNGTSSNAGSADNSVKNNENI